MTDTDLQVKIWCDDPDPTIDIEIRMYLDDLPYGNSFFNFLAMTGD